MSLSNVFKPISASLWINIQVLSQIFDNSLEAWGFHYLSHPSLQLCETLCSLSPIGVILNVLG